MGLRLVAAALLLVVLCSDVSGYRLQKRETQEKEVFAQLQEAAKGYWDQVSDTTQNWVNQIKSTAVNEKLSDMYQKGYSAMNTYLSIISDQVYHWWHSDE
ncbi:apolipoprotein C-II-like [Sceloporus undulatus]|uniref:apolipoprotein C-II-like n=1 Tax=Sceloporus undulatus TaxID=8520 RepID=UPI001C4D2205|nr:apolipoprotein C-II-like [Sceloporus undulatus]